MKLKLVDDAGKVPRYGTMIVQYAAIALGSSLFAVPEDVRLTLLQALGLSPLQIALATIILQGVATFVARITEKVPKQAPDVEDGP